MNSNNTRSSAPALRTYFGTIALFTAVAIWAAVTWGDMSPMWVRLTVATSLVAIFVLAATALVSFKRLDQDLARTAPDAVLAKNPLAVVNVLHPAFTYFIVALLWAVAALPIMAPMVAATPVGTGVVQEAVNTEAFVVFLDSGKNVIFSETDLIPGNSVEVFHSDWAGFTIHDNSANDAVKMVVLVFSLVLLGGMLFTFITLSIRPSRRNADLRTISKLRTLVRTGS